jgi:NitT/TauT family transport system substrate-binding protein
MKTPFATLVGLIAAASAVMSGTADAQSLRKVTINYGVNQFAPSTAPVFAIPKAMKFWEEEGLDVTIEGGAGGSAALQALVNKSSVMTFTGTPNQMQLRQAGVPLIAVASTYHRNIYYPVVKADGPISSLQDLKGKTVGVCRMASACVYWLDAVLEAEGIDPKTVAKVAPGDGAAAWHALNSGAIAGMMWWDAAYAQMETVGAKFKRFDKIPVMQGLTFIQGLFVHEDLIKSDPKLITGLLRGITKGVAFAKANPEAAVRIHWSVFPISKPASLSEEKAMANALIELNTQLNNMPDAAKKVFGKVSLDDVKAVTKVMVDQNVIKTSFAPEQYYTDQFISAANDFDIDAIVAKAKAHK